jgi:hypothetical protein
MNESSSFVEFFHSLLRWGVLLSVAIAGLAALVGYLRKAPIIVWERSMSVLAMVLCHVQLVVGVILYAMRWNSFAVRPTDEARFWKFEHIGIMIIAIALVTIGRMTSKRAKTERGKQLRVAAFYLIALLLILWATPWPFTEMGAARGWL